MASTLCQKWLTIFCQKFEPHDLLQISPACGPNTYNNVKRGFRLSMSFSAMVTYQIGKSMFAVNMPLKVFHVTVANADTPG